MLNPADFNIHDIESRLQSRKRPLDAKSTVASTENDDRRPMRSPIVSPNDNNSEGIGNAVGENTEVISPCDEEYGG
jgi:hypothetical protein